MKFTNRWLLLGLLLALAPAGHAAVRMSHVFGSGMVLQRDKPLPVWGWAKPGEKVTVRFAGQEQSATAGADGAWRVQLAPVAASATGREMTVTGANTHTFSDVLVGDVWLCSGDFGTYWQMFSVVDADKELAAANYPSMRLLRVPLRSSNTPQDDFTFNNWVPCEGKTVNSFSALAYYFGRELHRELNVPIGLIDCSYRYSFMRSWLAPEGIRMTPELEKQRARLDGFDSTTPTGKQAFSATVDAVEKWLPLAQQALQEGKPLPPQPLTPAPITARDDNYVSMGELGVTYYGMVTPLIPFAIRGMVWSQGENGDESTDHEALLRALAGGWRKVWGQGDFPFIYEMLPQVNNVSPTPCNVGFWSNKRFQQMKALGTIPNSGLAVTYDVSDYVADQRNRLDAGWRMARWALAKEYGKPVVASGPTYRSHRIEGNKIVVEFDNVGAGLMAGRKVGMAPLQEAPDGALQQFAIAGEDKKWQWAKATIAGNTVVLQNDAVPAPVAASYATCDNPQPANLYNRDGLPATPFHTGNK